MPNAPPQSLAAPPRYPLVAPSLRDVDAAPSFDALLRHFRQELSRVFQLPPDTRAKEDQAILSLANRAFARYNSPDKTALPPPLKQVDAYLKGPNQNESLSHYLYARRADLALDSSFTLYDADDKDGIGEPSPDDDRDSDEDAIGSEHPRSPSLGPTASPAGAHRQLDARLPTPSPSSSPLTTGTAGNTTVSSPEPRSTLSAPPQQKADQKKSGSASASASAANGVDHAFTGDDRCTNCIMRNNPTCIVNSSRQRCDSCFLKRHRCSKVLTPPTRPARDTKSTSVKGKAPGNDAPADTNGDSPSTRAPKRKRTATEEDTKRNESAAKRPARPQRPTAAAASSAAGTSASASAPVQRLPAPKKPPMQNGNAAASSSNAQSLSLAALAASASRAPRAPTNNNNIPPSRIQYYNEKLQVISGILGMVQTAVKELQDQVNADAAAGR